MSAFIFARPDGRRRFAVELRAFVFICSAIWAGQGCHNPVEGRTSFEVLKPKEPPAASSGAKGTVESAGSYLPGYPKAELAKPVYPPDALKARAGDCVVYVTVTIDETGHVSEVAPSWRGIGTQNRYSGEFLDAVRAAVGRWEFVPSQIVTYEEGPDGEGHLKSAVAVAETVDLKFTFEASGRVR